MKTKQKLISLKPTELDASFKYVCPKCGLDHWLFLRETQTKNYKVVCECGVIFKPKTIHKLKIIYNKHKSKTDILPVELLNQCAKILGDLGFSKDQSVDLIKKSYKQTKSKDITLLIKTAVTLFGDEKNV